MLHVKYLLEFRREGKGNVLLNSAERKEVDQVKQWWIEERAKRAVEKLVAHDFEAVYAETKEEAVRELWRHITPKQKIGVGGSLTVRGLGVLEKLEAQDYTIYDHWKPGLSRERILELRKLQMTSDLFLSSVNAVTLNGELVNIDGIGNRVNAISFGPEKVILVAGYNKIVKDVQEGIERIKNVSAPLNARRLNIDVPCAKAGKCVDCNSPNRICRALVIHERKPSWTDILIILVGEELGF